MRRHLSWHLKVEPRALLQELFHRAKWAKVQRSRGGQVAPRQHLLLKSVQSRSSLSWMQVLVHTSSLDPTEFIDAARVLCEEASAVHGEAPTPLP